MKMQCGAEPGGQIRGQYVGPGQRRVVADGIEGSVGHSVLPAQGYHTVRECVNGTELGVAGATVAYGFVTHTVLLTVESEGHKRRRKEVVKGAHKVIQSAGTDPEANVTKTKLCGARRAEVFARSEQEKETDNETIGGGTGMGSVIVCGEATNLRDQGQREWFDPRRRVVSGLPSTIQR